MTRERVLVVVHRSTAEGWERRDPVYAAATEADGIAAGRLLKKLKKAERRYTRIIEFEDNPWEPDVPSTARYTWGQVAHRIGLDCDVDIAGVKLSVCVAKVASKLKDEGVRVRIKKQLTID